MAHRTLAAWLWTAFVLALVLLPRHLTPERPPTPGSFHLPPHFDKVVHACLFAGFGFLWSRATGASSRTSLIVISGVMLAVGTELAQSLPIVDRDPDVLDALADVVGLVGGIASYRLVARPVVVDGAPG